MKFHAADIHVDRVETVEEATVACTWAYDTNEYRRREDDTDERAPSGSIGLAGRLMSRVVHACRRGCDGWWDGYLVITVLTEDRATAEPDDVFCESPCVL